MLQLLSPDGVDLTQFPPQLVAVSVPAVNATSSVRIECSAVQNDAVAFNQLCATLNWNDGTLPVVFNSASPLSLDVSRILRPGSYIIQLEVSDFELPTPQKLTVNFPVDINVTARFMAGPPVVYGPIMPKDAGYPNPRQWDFNRGTDLDIVTSSLKMLLTTSKGERIMLPEYGTNLRLLLFDFQSPGTATMCQQEIIDALTKWEPRADLVALNMNQTAAREVTLQLIFTSKLNQQQFPLAIAFAT